MGEAVAVVVQARMSSQRLPGKVLRPLAGAPAIVRMLERVQRVKSAAACVLATSREAGDDPLAEAARAQGVAVARGPLDDVLTRVVEAVPPGCGTVVRLTGDCPLVDPALVDRHVAVFEQEQPWAEYVTNARVRTFPDGLDVEVVRRDVLVRAAEQATLASDREHVLPWVARRARTVPVCQEQDLSALRWTLDTQRDYEILSAIYERLHPGKPDFTSRDVYGLLAREPGLIHVAGQDALDEAERERWVERIRAHLASGEST